MQTLSVAQLKARLGDNLGPIPVLVEDADGDVGYPVLDAQLTAIADADGSTPVVVLRIGELPNDDEVETEGQGE